MNTVAAVLDGDGSGGGKLSGGGAGGAGGVAGTVAIVGVVVTTLGGAHTTIESPS